MTSKRARERAEARQRWMREKADAHDRTRRVKERVTTALGKARFILADREFRELLRLRSVQSMPRFPTTTSIDGEFVETDIKPERLNEISLEFTAMWCFLFPLLQDAVIARHLEDAWPGFSGELKDAFISLVIDGPFPYDLSGHSKGWRAAFYNFGVRDRFKALGGDDVRALMTQSE
jgi:hypothetical protein